MSNHSGSSCMQQEMMEVAVSTNTMCKELQWNHRHLHINTEFYGTDALPVAQPTENKLQIFLSWKEKHSVTTKNPASHDEAQSVSWCLVFIMIKISRQSRTVDLCVRNENWTRRWLLDDSEMPGERSGTLVLDSVSHELNNRRLTCEATNAVGTARLDHTLEVECK